MKFGYKRLGPDILRPIIPVEVIVDAHQVTYEVLIDSGADLSIFDADIAKILGLDLVSGRKEEVRGVTGAPAPYYIHRVDLRVGGWLHPNIEVGFMPGLSIHGHGIVGQRGFFDRFVVRFSLLHEEIELKPYPPRVTSHQLQTLN